MGQQAWASSEPPLTIGRGLTAATGAIGSLLALAVLWTMLPTHAGRNAGVSVRSTVATVGTVGSSSSLTSPSTTDATPATDGGSDTTDVDEPTSSVDANTGSSVVPSVDPLPTYAVSVGTAVEPVAVAVAVNDGSLIITTAAAVSADNTVELLLPDGGTEQAQVLLVDQRSGFAVLAHDTEASLTSFTVATAVVPGDELTFYGAEHVTAVVQDDGTFEPTTTDPSVPVGDLPEGTPVVNQRGELVALCSHSDGEATLVSLEHLDSLRRALAEGSEGKVWMGVVLDTAAEALQISALDAKGPAATAGLLEGDVIVSIDGVTVLDVTAIGAALAAHQPGDVVPVEVERDGASITIDVTLAAPRPSL
jgi:S1-C subfamily serine protease